MAPLIGRRPVQESAGKLPEKIESLGRQCGSPSVPPDVFERLAEQGANLKADLSQEGKQGDLPREVLIELFNRSVTWLAALLRVLDQSRMKT